MTIETTIAGDQVANALQSVLSSRTFARSERLRAFLKFIVEMEQSGLSHRLKGYTIGIDVFSRNEGFDAGSDPLVRVQAGKLRRLLNAFYADEGRAEPLRIRIPLGGYVPVYEIAGSSRKYSANLAGLAELDTKHRHLDALPRLFLRQPLNAARRSHIFLNALKLWTDRLWAVAIAMPNERSADESRPVHPLHFELRTDEDISTGSLLLSLRHIGSDTELLPKSDRVLGTETDSLALGALANQFAGTNLTIPGRIYRYCHTENLSTGPMKCLDATYRYTLERTDDAYLKARRHQMQWPGLSNEADVITEIPRLIALSGTHG